MKYFKAILFTLLMAFIFFGVIIFVEGVFAARKMAEVITESLEEDNYHVLLRANFQSNEPIIHEVVTTDEFTLDIRGYETAAIIEGELRHYLEFTIVTIDGEIGLTDMEASIKTDTEEIPIWFLKYFNLEVYIVVLDPTSYHVFEISDIFKNDAVLFESIVLSYTPESATSETEVIVEIQKQETDFIFGNILLDYYNNHNNRYPTEETNEIKLYQHVEINTFSALITAGGITLVLIVLFTYYIYSVRSRRKLGRTKPSSNLQKDIERIHQIESTDKRNE